jgi:ubiquinone/menaquinone biosynthesis C-methylase UbiE
MGWYLEQVVPRLTDKMLDTPIGRDIRDRVCARASGDVLELGAGSGLNLAHLPPAVTGLWAVEPSSVARRLAEKRAEVTPFPVQEAGLDGQRLNLPDQRFDTVLSTFTLCTIPDPLAALREVARVLKPGGRFLFAEHGLAPDASVVRWQRRLQPMQRRMAGGCHLTRAIDQLVAAELTVEELSADYAGNIPRPLGYLYEGVASRR